MSEELNNIARRYYRRSKISASRYSRINPVVNLMVQERQRILIRLFKSLGINDLSDLKVLEVGCGSGANLLELIQLGAVPENLVGNELLQDRLAAARQRLPEATKLLAGDASRLPLPDNTFDIVYQSTVFSSILDDDLQASLARKMWRLARGGCSGTTSFSIIRIIQMFEVSVDFNKVVRSIMQLSKLASAADQFVLTD
jgi:ubiquinone/menaquinone biosynthesis C-methylase UbiE